MEPIVEVLGEHGLTIAASTYYAHAARSFGPTGVEVAEAYAAHEPTTCGSRTGGSTASTSCGRPHIVPGSPVAATRSRG